MKNQLIIPSAEPFFFQGSRTGCLVIHGFTGTPREMRPLGEYLANQGHTVLGMRLTGHATDPQDMPHTKWKDWLASVEDGIHLLRSCTDRLFLLGLSMGGALSLLSAARYPVDGIVTLSAPVSLLPDPRMRFIRLLSHLQPEVGKGPPDWHDPTNEATHIAYPNYPTPSVIELIALLKEVRGNLPRVTVPALIIQSKADTTIRPESLETIYQEIGSAVKEKMWVENSGHVITLEPDKEAIFAAADAFIRKVVSAA